jgi:hypothetical protein
MSSLHITCSKNHIIVGKIKGKIPEHIWECSIKIDLTDIGCDCIELAKDRSDVKVNLPRFEKPC